MLFGGHRILLRREPARDGRAAGEAVPPAAEASQRTHALLQPVLPSGVFYCLFLASLVSLRGKLRLQREKPEKTQSWEAAEGKLPAGSTFLVMSLQLIYTLEGSSAPWSCEIQSPTRHSGSGAQTERGSSKAEIFDNIFYS